MNDGRRERTADALGRFARGEADGFRELLELQADRLYRLAYHVVGDATLAEDVVQESFLRILHGKHPDRMESADSWIARIATRVALDLLRQRTSQTRREKEYAEMRHDAGDRTNERAAKNLEQEEFQEELGRALGQLDDEHRAMLWLHVVEGESIRNVASTLGTTSSTASRRVRGGLQDLRKKLEMAGFAGVLTVGLESSLQAMTAPAIPASLTASLKVLATQKAAAGASATIAKSAYAKKSTVTLVSILGGLLVVLFLVSRPSNERPTRSLAAFDPATSVRGRIYLPDGSPAKNATVRLSEEHKTRCNAKGEFVLPGLEVPKHQNQSLQIHAPGTARESVRVSPGDVIEKHLLKEARVVLQVDLGGAKAVVLGASAKGPGNWYSGVQDPTTDGRAEIRGMKPGTYDLSAAPVVNGRERPTLPIDPVELAEGQTLGPVKLELADFVSIKGRVVREGTGTPVEGATLTTSRPGEELETVSDRSGHFRFDGFTIQHGHIYARIPDEGAGKVWYRTNGISDENVEIVFKPFAEKQSEPVDPPEVDESDRTPPVIAELRGKISDDRGEPVEHATIFLYPVETNPKNGEVPRKKRRRKAKKSGRRNRGSSAPFNHAYPTDPDGSYDLEVPPGRYWVKIDAPKRGAFLGRDRLGPVDLREGNNPNRDWELSTYPTRILHLQGRIVDPAGRPIPHMLAHIVGPYRSDSEDGEDKKARVCLAERSTRSPTLDDLEFRTNENGEFSWELEVEDVAIDRIRFYGSHRSGMSAYSIATVVNLPDDGNVVQITAEEKLLSGLRLYVEKADGSPASNARVATYYPGKNISGAQNVNRTRGLLERTFHDWDQVGVVIRTETCPDICQVIQLRPGEYVEARVRPRPLGTAMGVVRYEDGRPLSNARVLVGGRSLEEMLRGGCGDGKIQTTDDGTFSTPSLPIGQYWVAVHLPDRPPVEFQRRILAGTNHWELVVKDPASTSSSGR